MHACVLRASIFHYPLLFFPRAEHLQSELVRSMYSDDALETLLKETDDVAEKR